MAHSLQVAGIPDTILLPLQHQQALALLAIAEPVPSSPSTVASSAGSAGSCMSQISASHIHTSDVWQQHVRKMSLRAARGLDVKTPYFEAHLQKMLLYTAGAHYQSQEELDEDAQTFATMFVQLPVAGGHQGGLVEFSYVGNDVQWATEASSSTTFHCAACFPAAQQEMQRITAGMRAVLVYKLVHTKPKTATAAVDWKPLVKQLRAAVDSWEQDLSTGVPSTPPLLCVPMDSWYRSFELESARLKGPDKNLVALLNHPEAGLDVFFAEQISAYTRIRAPGPNSYTETRRKTVEVRANVFGMGLGKPLPKLGTTLLSNTSIEDVHGNAVAWETKHSFVPSSPTFQQGYDEVATDFQAMLTIWPMSQTVVLLGKDNLRTRVFLLQRAMHSGTAADVAGALQDVVAMFTQPVATPPAATTADDREEEMALAVRVVGGMDSKLAVPALQTILQHLPHLGNPGRGRRQLPYSILKAIEVLGTSSTLVEAACNLVASRAQAHMQECTELAILAAEQFKTMFDAVIDTLLSHTVLASDAQQVLGQMSARDVAALAAMLCKLPSHRKHLVELAAVVAAMPGNREVVLHLLEDRDSFNVKAAMKHSPQAIAKLLQAGMDHTKQDLDMKAPEFSWQMGQGLSMPERPDIEGFLRGPEVEATFIGWEHYGHAKGFVQRYFGWVIRRAGGNTATVCKSTYSVRMQVSDPVPGAQVVITKTRELHEKKLQAYEAHLSSLRKKIDTWAKLLRQCEQAAL